MAQKGVHLKIFDARKRVLRDRLVAAAIMIVAALFFVCSALKGLYFVMQSDISPVESLARGISGLIYMIYQRTQLIAWVWEWAPVINPRTWNSPANLGFLLWAVIGAIGRTMWDSAGKLSARITATIRKVEELGWERELLRQGGQTTYAKPDVLQINIDLKQDEEWFKRPVGMTLLGVATVIIGQLAIVKLGLTT
jgi:hypothetical protein